MVAAVGGGGGVFHGPAHVVAHGYLGVLFPRVFHAQLFGEELQHFGRVAEHGAGGAGVLRLHVVVDGLAVPGVAHDGKVAHYHGSQVGRVGLAQLPGIGAGAVGVGFGGNEQAVGKRFELLFHGQADFLGHALVGLVDGGKPAGAGLRLALRPDLAGLVFFGAQRVDEVQALIGGNGGRAALRAARWAWPRTRCAPDRACCAGRSGRGR